MPIYEFTCSGCGSRFEELRLSSSGFTGIACPECGSKDVEKAFSTFAPSVSAGRHSAGRYCPDGECPTPSNPCSGGMCGFN